MNENLKKTKENKNMKVKNFPENEIMILKDAGYKEEEIGQLSSEEFKIKIENITKGKKEEIKEEERLNKKDNIPLSHIVKADKYKWEENRDTFTEEEINLLVDREGNRKDFNQKWQFDEDSVRKLGPATYGNYFNWLKDELKNKEKQNIEASEVSSEKAEKKEDKISKKIVNKISQKNNQVNIGDKNIKNKEISENDEIRKIALEKIKQGATIVNIEDIAEAEARKAADANMAESKASKEISWYKKIWKHTFFDEYYRQKEVNKVREEIKNSGNIYTGRLDNKLAHINTMKAVSDRFISEYKDTLSDGESKKILDNKNPETIKLESGLTNIINSYANGSIDEESFNKQKNTLIKDLKNEELLKSANNFADNLFEIAQNAKLAIEHGAKMKELDYNLNIIVGKAKSSLKTEAHFNWVDQGIDRMKKSKVGRFVSPAVLSTAIGLGYSISVGASRKIMSSKAATFATLGGAVLVSSAFAGLNESQRVALERKQHGIEMAEGSTSEEGDKRREQLEKYQYAMESSNNLTHNLRDLMFEKDENGNDVIKDIKEEDLEKIISSLAEIDARKGLNVKNKIDLISYSSIGNVEKESTELTILVARTKVELRKKLDGKLKNGLQGKDLESYLREQTEIIENTLLGGEKGISAKDKAFRKYKAKRIANKMAQTAVAGLIIGGTIQEAAALFRDDVQGFAEGIFKNDSSATVQTPFESIKDWILGNSSHMGMENASIVGFMGHNINIPEGTSLIDNGDGTFDLLKGNNIITNNFKPIFDINGNLDQSSIESLGKEGIIVNSSHQLIESTKEVINTPKEWMANNPDETIKVDRNMWYGNDTDMYNNPETGKLLGADLNELGTRWGGINGTGIDSNGDYVLNISQMTSDGSFQNGLSVDAKEAMGKGDLMALIILDGANQGQGIPVPIDSSGNIIFDHNNPIMQQIFSKGPDGQMVSHAKFIEIVQKMGVDANGTEHIRTLSTLVGEGLDKIKDIIPSHIDTPIINLSPSLDTEMPMFVPLVGRRPLGKVTQEKNNKIEENNNNTLLKENKKFKAGDVVEFTDTGIKRLDKSEAEDGTGIKNDKSKVNPENVIIEDNNEEIHSGLKENNEVKINETSKEDEKIIPYENLSKIGTEFKSESGTFKVTNIKSSGGFFGFFGRTIVETIFTDKNGKETLLSYNKNELERELKKGNIELINIIDNKNK